MAQDRAQTWFDDMGLDLHHIALPRLEENGPWSFHIEDDGPDAVKVSATKETDGTRKRFRWPKG